MKLFNCKYSIKELDIPETDFMVICKNKHEAKLIVWDEVTRLYNKIMLEKFGINVDESSPIFWKTRESKIHYEVLD